MIADAAIHAQFSRLAEAPAARTLIGKAILSAVATQQLTRFSLDLVGLHVGKVSVNGRRAEKFTARSNKLHIWLDRPVPVGASLTVEIGYSGNPGPRSGP